MNNEIPLELLDSDGMSVHTLRGGEKFEYKGYIIKYVSLIFNEETKGFEAKLRVVKSSL